MPRKPGPRVARAKPGIPLIPLKKRTFAPLWNSSARATPCRISLLTALTRCAKNVEMQAANRAFSMRIAKDVLQDLRKQYPGVAAHARLAKPRPGQVEQAQQQSQTQPTQP